MHSHLKAVVFLLFSAIYIAGCGQKGPLFLPGNTNEVSTSIPKQQASRDDEEEDDEKPISRN